MTDPVRPQLDQAVAEVLSGRPVRTVAREFKLPRSSLVRAVERARTSTPNGEPRIPPGATFPSPLEDVLRRLGGLESKVLARAALDGIPANVFDDLLEDEPDDELKGRKSGSPMEN